MKTVLLAGHRRDALDVLIRRLELAEFQVLLATDGTSAIAKAKREMPEVIVLNPAPPEADGFEVLRALKSDPVTRPIPVLILAARATLADRLEGLALGADDYIAKPFSAHEVVLRIEVLVRPGSSPARLKAGPFLLDCSSMSCFVAGNLLRLTATEFKLLTLLLTQWPKIVSRELLLKDVWGSEVSASRTLDTHVKRLRRKLGSYGDALVTARGRGYRLILDWDGYCAS